jgi:hypothetical protein
MRFVRTTKAVVNDLQLLKRQLVRYALAPGDHEELLKLLPRT